MTPIQNGGYFRLKMNNHMYLCCLEFVSCFNYYSLLTITNVTIAKSVMNSIVSELNIKHDDEVEMKWLS